MDFLSLVSKRQSDRSYLDKPVDRQVIKRCIEAARLSPSACNAQPWHFIVVDDPDLKNQVAEATSSHLLPLNHFTRKAPVHIVVVKEAANITSSLGSAIKEKEFPLIDVGIATSHLCLQAASEGLGTCILGWFNEKKVKNILQVPSGKRVLLIITLGYPAGKTREKKRKPLGQVMSYNSYSESNG